MFTADVFILQVFIVIYVKNLHFDNNNTPWWNIGPVYVCLYVYIFFFCKKIILNQLSGLLGERLQ